MAKKTAKTYLFLTIGKGEYYTGFVSSKDNNFRSYRRYKRITKWDLDHECRIEPGSYLIEIPMDIENMDASFRQGYNDALEHIGCVIENAKLGV